ncbi:hypothetical protein L0244_12280 [bacterium]|nr:hypothetical protein [bacterium]
MILTLVQINRHYNEIKGQNNWRIVNGSASTPHSYNRQIIEYNIGHILEHWGNLFYMTLKLGKSYRKGPIGALMDEYERAALELKMLVKEIPPAQFVRIIDNQTSDEDCRSVQTIMSHVVRAGYGYADYIRYLFSISSTRPAIELLNQNESLKQIELMLEYTVQTLDGKWEMPDEVIVRTTIHSLWGVKYDLEQLLEHAIVHILRHRRQIEKLMQLSKIQEEMKNP